MDSAATTDDVEDLLAHLYDQPYLQTHRLARVLVAEPPPPEGRARALQRILIDGIQALKPSSDATSSPLAWRKYRYLYLRYIEALSVPEVAGELGISVRQSRRYHGEALSALASLLADRSPGRSLPDSPRQSLIAEEVARVAAVPAGVTADVPQAIASVLSTLTALAAGRGIELDEQVRGDLPPAQVERGALRQILLNMLLSCLAHSATALRLEAAAVSSGVEIRMTVMGDADELGSRLRLDRRYQVSAQLCQAQGSAIEVEATAPGQLAIVVRVPSARVVRVLVIDDNPDIVQLFRRYLAGGRYEVVSASSAVEALRLARRAAPDLVILDVMMPSQDGWEVLQALKTDEATRDTPVIVCSVLQEPDLARALGAAQCLSKPITQAELLAAFERHLPAGRAAPAPRAGRPDSAGATASARPPTGRPDA